MLLWKTAAFPQNGIINFSQICRAIISSFIVDVGIEPSKKNSYDI